MWAAVLAQLVERKALNLVVQGSSPWDGELSSTSFFPVPFCLSVLFSLGFFAVPRSNPFFKKLSPWGKKVRNAIIKSVIQQQQPEMSQNYTNSHNSAI